MNTAVTYRLNEPRLEPVHQNNAVAQAGDSCNVISLLSTYLRSIGIGLISGQFIKDGPKSIFLGKLQTGGHIAIGFKLGWETAGAVTCQPQAITSAAQEQAAILRAQLRQLPEKPNASTRRPPPSSAPPDTVWVEPPASNDPTFHQKFQASLRLAAQQAQTLAAQQGAQQDAIHRSQREAIQAQTQAIQARTNQLQIELIRGSLQSLITQGRRPDADNVNHLFFSPHLKPSPSIHMLRQDYLQALNTPYNPNDDNAVLNALQGLSINKKPFFGDTEKCRQYVQQQRDKFNPAAPPVNANTACSEFAGSPGAAGATPNTGTAGASAATNTNQPVVTVQTLQAWGLEIPNLAEKSREEKIRETTTWLQTLARLLELKTGEDIAYDSKVTLPTLDELCKKLGIHSAHMNSALDVFNTKQQGRSKNVFSLNTQQELSFQTRRDGQRRVFLDTTENLPPIKIDIKGQQKETANIEKLEISALLRKHPYDAAPGHTEAARDWLVQIFTSLNHNPSKVDGYVLPTREDIAQALKIDLSKLNDILQNLKLGPKLQVTQVGNRRRTVYVPVNPTDTGMRHRIVDLSEIWQPTNEQRHNLDLETNLESKPLTRNIVRHVILKSLSSLAEKNKTEPHILEYVLPSVSQIASEILRNKTINYKHSNSYQVIVSDILAQINNNIPHLPNRGRALMKKDGKWVFYPRNVAPYYNWR
jgi:hypothetical protein